MKSLLVVFVALVLLVAYAAADCYMHNPRGSNDRLNEANTNRNNGNRCFDSQNNAQGGYCWGPPLYFYEGSLLSVEWTNQHGCGVNPRMYCNIVLQFMCSDSNEDPGYLVRDGQTTDTIPNNAQGPYVTDPNAELLYGMHEPYQWYKDCRTRDRNFGLFIADRATKGGLDTNRRQAIFTRQNNGGTRSGYECAEERDYYPYWHPSPWRDIAILTHDTSYCNFYKSHSQNVVDMGWCEDKNNLGNHSAQNNQVACVAAGNEWHMSGKWRIPPPDCVQAPWTRENHNGNGQTGHQVSYNWTMPTSDHLQCINDNNCNCVLRIRYNISTGDLGSNGNRPDRNFIDWTKSGSSSPVKQDPTVNVYGNNLTLALDTTQYGRTFQDRSHVFNIKKRPSSISPLARIFNLNVRGKRGNVVQTYPATEYDFVPSILYARVGDYIHFQWTGCDTNPAGNAGEGRDGTDRSNIVQVSAPDRNIPASNSWMNSHTPLFGSNSLRVWMSYIGQTNCKTYEELQASGNADQDTRNCYKLNAAPTPYFDGGLIQMNHTGNFYYISTRNNNFSNRDQKGTIYVTPLLPVWAIVLLSIGGAAFLGSAGLAGMMHYAKSNPTSQVAALLSRF